MDHVTIRKKCHFGDRDVSHRHFSPCAKDTNSLVVVKLGPRPISTDKVYLIQFRYFHAKKLIFPTSESVQKCSNSSFPVDIWVILGLGCAMKRQVCKLLFSLHTPNIFFFFFFLLLSKNQKWNKTNIFQKENEKRVRELQIQSYNIDNHRNIQFVKLNVHMTSARAFLLLWDHKIFLSCHVIRGPSHQCQNP